MNLGSDPADQVVRYTLEGTEFALRLSGTAAKNFAVFVAAVLRDQKKTRGKTNLTRLLREGKPLKFFSVPADRMREFAQEAKRHGLLFVPMRDRNDPEHIEVAIWAEDSAKVERIIDRMQLDVVGLRSVGPQLSISETGERSKEGPRGAFHHPSGFALQTGGLAGRQAVETGEAEIMSDVTPEQPAQNQAEPDHQNAPPNDEPIPFGLDNPDGGLGFTQPAPLSAEPEDPPFSRSTPTTGPRSVLPSASKNRSPNISPALRAAQARARGERPSVREELRGIKAMLNQREAAAPQPKMPIRIHRGDRAR